mmetsp:Transcript_2602/g.5678  ORF Transcript_2602/g.5678 Transcript_2602/m.5678 type:complete len:102 (-) Transcript_2602:536-841(-)
MILKLWGYLHRAYFAYPDSCFDVRIWPVSSPLSLACIHLQLLHHLCLLPSCCYVHVASSISSVIGMHPPSIDSTKNPSTSLSSEGGRTALSAGMSISFGGG